MKAIDTKMDDGLPASGYFSGGGVSGDTGNCYSTITEDYNVDITDPTCRGGLLGFQDN